MKDYYAILEVSPTASQKTIREQYILLIQAWHPDKFSNPSQKAKAEEKTKEINSAYDVLKDVQKRARYDSEFTGQSSRFREEQRRRQAAEEQQRKQAEEKRRRADYERRQKAREEEQRRTFYEKQKQAEEEKEKRHFEYEQFKRKQSKQPPVESNRIFLVPIRVLIVDDMTLTREHLSEFISSAPDMKVVGEASNGLEAIEKFSALMPDVVTMDINMPDMDGIAATKKICQKHPDARVIIITVQESSTYIRAARLAGAFDYLLIPPTVDELLSTIRRAVGSVDSD
jgi:curved DNA-binding protein CbpA